MGWVFPVKGYGVHLDIKAYGALYVRGMPSFAIYNEQIISPEDIYKFNINKSSEFTCYNCDKQLHFRQQRNADNNFTEHFYHPNTIKDTHIECDRVTLDSIKDIDSWHNTLSNFIEPGNREIIQRSDGVKHIVDAYDPLNNAGIEFQNSKISVEAIQSRDATTSLDWIFNVEGQYIRKVTIGKKIICEIPHDNWEKAVKVVKNTVFLYTGYKEWIYLEDRENYRIEIDGNKRNVWIGTPCRFNDIYENTCLQNILTESGKEYYNSIIKSVESVQIMYARCKKSMFLLDDIHREYVNRHKFSKGDILAIKSVAGSGKTTTLLNLAKIHKSKKILYIAFNKSLIEEIKTKLFEQKISNLYPQTFDSLLVSSYCMINNKSPNIKDLNAQKITDIYPWLKGKPFRLRNSYVKKYKEFCNNPNEQLVDTTDKVLTSIWQSTLKGEFISFDSLRKLSVLQKWFKDTVDKKYDMIMIDETQDFDIMMLRMLLDNTTIPKIFVGDPKQSIYQWRGCVNGFNYMPKDALIIEFYSTFRVGDPACETIREQFDDCWMISKSKNTTTISNDISIIGDKKYTYLFRTWRQLLTTAEGLTTIWINSYDSKIADIRRKHAILSKVGNAFDDDEFEDDLPKFLKSITADQLEEMIANIEVKLADKDEAACKLYTVHGYKGLEDDNIRIASDIELDDKEEIINVYYVALTRGMKHIIMDSPIQPKLQIPIIPTHINGLIAWKQMLDADVRRLTDGVGNEFINHPYVESVQMKISDFFYSNKSPSI